MGLGEGCNKGKGGKRLQTIKSKKRWGGEPKRWEQGTGEQFQNLTKDSSWGGVSASEERGKICGAIKPKGRRKRERNKKVGSCRQKTELVTVTKCCVSHPVPKPCGFRSSQYQEKRESRASKH